MANNEIIIRLQFIEYILKDIKNYSKQEESIYKKVIKEKITLILNTNIIESINDKEIIYNESAISLYKIALYEYYMNISNKSDKSAILNKIIDGLNKDHLELIKKITTNKDYIKDLNVINNLYINI